MTIQRSNPDGLSKPQAYSQLVVAAGSRLVFVAGQVAADAAGNVVSEGDLEGQARQAFSNLATALASAGAGPADVTKITIFVVHYSAEQLPAIGEARRALFGDTLPASTLLGVEALARPEFLIEVEAIAVLD
jgi:enamine deaminase RidA (YjgF/YER057c/UK114 family)